MGKIDPGVGDSCEGLLEGFRRLGGGRNSNASRLNRECPDSEEGESRKDEGGSGELSKKSCQVVTRETMHTFSGTKKERLYSWREFRVELW